MQLLMGLVTVYTQAEYRRLYAMYDELKAQKIQEMEGLVQEQDSYIVKMGEVNF